MSVQRLKTFRCNVFRCWLLLLLPWMCSMSERVVDIQQPDDVIESSAQTDGVPLHGVVSSEHQEIEDADLIYMVAPAVLTSTPQTPLTLVTAPSRFQQYPPMCRPDLATPPVQPGIATLLRISTFALQNSHPDIPPSFHVDSTISKIVIQVTSTDPLSTTILDPNGGSINSRSKRDVVHVINPWQTTLRQTDIHHVTSSNLTSYSQTHQHLLLNKIRQNTVLSIINHRTRNDNNFQSMLKDNLYGRRNKRTVFVAQAKTVELSNNFVGIIPRFKAMHINSDGTNLQISPPGGARNNPRRNQTRNPGTVLDDPSPGEHRLRRTRSAHVTNNRTSEETVRRDIDTPDTGLWSISTSGSESANIIVMAVTSFDFRFEFFDLTMTAMNYPPIANENTLVRLYMTPGQCLINVTRLDLSDDAGLVLGSYDAIDLSPGADGATLVVMSPHVPFYISIRGFDVMGLKFQRISPVRVVPRLFVISVSHRPDPPLTPGTDFRFSLFLRNKDRRDRFKVSVQFNNQNFMARLPQTTFIVNPGEMMPIFISVNVSQDIYFQETSIMTVTARRLSDNLTDIVSENLTAVPAVYKTDHEPPSCSVVSSNGGCRPGLSCSLQRWIVDTMVADRLTGVASANFVNTETGTYTNIQFSYVTRNHTAIASYRYTCCNPEIFLEVKDYANNTGRCLVQAPVLDPLTPSATTQTRATPPRTSPKILTVSAILNRSPTPPTTIRERPLIVTNSPAPIFQNTVEELVAKLTSESDFRITENISVVTQEATMTPPWRMTQGSPRGLGFVNVPRKKLESWDDDKYSTLKLGAIIVGSIGGTAGLAIVLVCTSYKCAHRKPATRQGRQGSNASDITMGSSWESRSDTSSGTDSIRLKKMIESDESSLELGTSGYVTSSENFSESKSMRNSILINKETKMDDHEKSPKEVHFQQQRRIQDSVTRRRDDDVEDVIFKCVIVGEDNSGFGKSGAVKNPHESKVSNSANNSPLLQSAGKTYTSMVEVQKNLMDMEAQRSLARGISQHPRRSHRQNYEMRSQNQESDFKRQETEIDSQQSRMGNQTQQDENTHLRYEPHVLGEDQKDRSEKQSEYVVQIYQPKMPIRQVGVEHRQIGPEHRQINHEHRQINPEHRQGYNLPGRDDLTPGSPKIGINCQADVVCELCQTVTCSCNTGVSDQEVSVQSSSDYSPGKIQIHSRRSVAPIDIGRKKVLRLLQSDFHTHSKTISQPVQLNSKTDFSCENLQTRLSVVSETGKSETSSGISDSQQDSVQTIPPDVQLTTHERSLTQHHRHPGESYSVPRGAGISCDKTHPLPTPDFRRRVLEQNFNVHRRRVSAPCVSGGAHELMQAGREHDSSHRVSPETRTASSTRVLHTSPDLSYVHRSRLVPGSPTTHRQVSTVITISDQSQWELHHNIQHVRDKLLLLQSKVDRNLEADVEHIKSESDSD